jgi:hypothetical protein
VFATLIVPDRQHASVVLQLRDVEGLVKAALVDFQKNPQIPQILSDAAWAAADAGTQEKLYGLISGAPKTVTAG